MKKFLFIILLILPFLGFSQETTLSSWNFEDSDNIADVAITANVSATIDRDNVDPSVAITYPTGYGGGLSIGSNRFHKALADGEQFWKTQISTAGYTNIVVSSRQSGSSTSAPRDFKLQYSLNDVDWVDVSGGVVSAELSWTGGFLDNVVLPATCNNQSVLYLRWFKYSEISIGGGTLAWASVSWLDDISIIGTPLTSNDNDSQILAGDISEPQTISSLYNSVGNKLLVFDFKFSDLATGDTEPTIINSVSFSQGTGNDISDWTNVIAGAMLFGDDLSSGISGSVSANSIDFSQSSMISVNSGTTESYQLYVWLKTDLSAINDNDNLAFKLDYNDVSTDYTGSSFGSGIIESGNTNNAVDIVATELRFSNVPSNVGLDKNFSLTVNATDLNGNIDLDNSENVVLSLSSGTGNFSSVTGLTQDLSSGSYSWNDLKYDKYEDFSITATGSILNSITTGVISCADYIYFLDDDFEDGDLVGWTESISGHWQASTTDPINGTYSLHQVFDASASASDRISYPISGLDLNADTTIWMFEVKYPRDPYSTNRWNVFLVSDANYDQMYSGGAVSGFVIGVDFSGTSDLLTLWKIENGSVSTLLETTFNWKDSDFDLPKSIQVIRTPVGEWEIQIDDDGGFDNLASLGSVTETSVFDINYFAVTYDYTSSADNLLWLDDIYVGRPIPDLEPPAVSDIQAISPNKLQITFNEELNTANAEQITNYTVDGGIGNPSSAVLNSTNKRIVELTFSASFQESTSYNISIENITDVSGNQIISDVYPFLWENISVEGVIVVSETEIDVVFSKQVDPSTSETLTNYSVNNSIGTPVSATVDVIDASIVHLSFGNSFSFEQSYLLHVENVEDVVGNVISATDFSFDFYMVRPYDVVINELMVDVSPAPVALPASKYIEIYNSSDYDVNISNWTLTIGTNSDLVFPSMIISPHEYVIVCSTDDNEFFSHYANTAAILVESYLTSSSGKQITIKDSKGQLMEQITYDPDLWYGDEDKDDGGWSMERIDPTNYCNQDNNWHASNNYTGGTPGMINSVYGLNPDETYPSLENIYFETSHDISIDFSETLDSTLAVSQLSYVLNSSITPLSIILDSDDRSIVHLYFLDNLNFGENILKVRNVSDLCGNVIPDTLINFDYELINPVDVEPKSSLQLKVYFSEPVSKASAENTLNYVVDNGIGTPTLATLDADDHSVVHLLFNNAFTENVKNTITISGITDTYSNLMTSKQLEFTYHVPEPFDIVINELMLDVNPEPLGLPPVQYIELFNTSDYDIWLSDWYLLPENQSERIFSDVKISSHGFVLICNEDDEALLDEFGTIAPILGSSDLSQSGKELLIYDNNGNLIYHVVYSDLWYNNENKEDGGWSLEKIDPFNFCESQGNWSASSDISGGTPGRQNSVFGSNTDDTNPVLTKLTVKSSNQLVVDFSKGISLETGLNAANYNVSTIGEPGFVSLVDGSYSSFNLFFDVQFTDEQQYSLSVNNITDDCSNSLSDTSVDFIYYLIHPEYVWVHNSNQLQIKFSETVDYNSALIKENYLVDGQIGNPNYVVRGTSDPSLIFIQFSNDFEEGKTYKLSVSGLKDVNGNVMKNAELEFVYYNAKVNDVVINEVLFNPYSGGVDFVELYNRSPYPINLLGLNIAKRDDEGNLASQYNISDYNSMLEPYSYLVVTTDSLNIQNTYNYGGMFAQINTLPSFPDDEGTVVLYDYRDSIIDEFNYNENMHYALISDPEGVSLERVDYNMPTQDSSNWHSAAESAGFATPGLVNSQYIDMSQQLNSGTVTLNPEVFSPDNDGYDDQLYINYSFAEGGNTADVYIFDKNGRLIRTLVTDELLGTEGYWIWDGLDDGNNKVRIGIYAVIVKVFNMDGTVSVYRKAAVVSGVRH